MIDMVMVANYIQKYMPKRTDIALSNNKDKNRPQLPSCCIPDCHAYPLSRCTICSSYCCYAHVYEHKHSIENFEILK
jgi:hypothetical protein